MKTCKKCGLTKPLDQFGCARGNRDRKMGSCKVCKKKANDLWKQNNPEAGKLNQRKHAQRRKESRYLKLYGMTLKEFETRKNEQHGRCAICGKQPTRWYVDHCHETGTVRALLCLKCNTMLGLAGDDTNVLENAVRYLLVHAD